MQNQTNQAFDFSTKSVDDLKVLAYDEIRFIEFYNSESEKHRKVLAEINSRIAEKETNKLTEEKNKKVNK